VNRGMISTCCSAHVVFACRPTCWSCSVSQHFFASPSSLRPWVRRGVALAYWLACLLLPRRFALLAALLLAIEPASIVFANQMMTETLFAFLLTLALALAVVAMRREKTILAAVAASCWVSPS
jgi:hypothetical protein